MTDIVDLVHPPSACGLMIWLTLNACTPPETAETPAVPRPLESLADSTNAAEDTSFGEMTFDRVQAEVFDDKCTGCHFHPPQSRYGSLVLDRNAYDGLTTGTSTGGDPYVVSGVPADSLLWLKLTGGQRARQGGDMPPYDELDASQLWLVEAWILEGLPR